MGTWKATGFTLIALVTVVFSLTGQQIAHDLKSSLSPASTVYFPASNVSVLDITRRWNAYNPPTYLVSVKPALKTDVQKIVNYARVHNVPFLATGGGHGYSVTLSGLQNGIDLDLGNFNSVSIDPSNNLMTIGGSVRFHNVTGPLQAALKEIPIGTCSCIGMTGATLGGGIGPYSGLYGTIADSLQSLDFVSGAGELLTVSESQNSDLFWGTKGAGFNFGVATSMTFKIYNATNGGRAMNADMIFLGSQNASLWRIAQSFVGNQPKELTITFGIGYNSTLEQLVFIGNFIYAGSIEDGKRLIKPFLDLKPANTNITSVPWKDLPDTALYGATVKGCVPGGDYTAYSLNLYKVDVDNLITISNFLYESMSTTPALQLSEVSFSQYPPQGFHLFKDDSSAYPFRDAVVYVSVDGFFLNKSDGPAVDAWGRELRSLFQQGSGKANLTAYVNLAHGDEGEDVWYTQSKLPRLGKLKKRYDPDSIFSNYNPIINA